MWSALGTQFCLELAFGLLLALAFVPRAPVGALFYRSMGTAALAPILIGVGIPLANGELDWSSPVVLASVPGALAYPLYSGPLRGVRWAAALSLALASSAAAVLLSLPGQVRELGLGAQVLAGCSALATGSVAGSVIVAMVLGHWYLTVPNLAVRHLQRLNRVTVACMLLSLVLLGASCLFFRRLLDEAETPLYGSLGLFHLGTRVAVGLLLPLAFAAMTASSLRFQNTRSATGILYASTVLVLIGTAVSVSLQDSYGLPL